MDSQQGIFVVLGLFYLLESLVWLPRGEVAIALTWNGRFRLRHPGRLFGNDRGAIALKAVAPPGRRMFLAASPPIAMSPEGIARERTAAAPQECLDWDSVDSISPAGRWIKINGCKWWKTPSEQNAVDLAKGLDGIRAAARNRRETLIQDWISDGFDVKEAKAALDGATAPIRRLEILGNILFVFLFVLLLPLSLFYSFQHLWGWIAGLTLLQTIPIGVIYRRTHRRLYPEADDERFTAWLTMLLFAPSAIRAHDGVALPLLYRFHPLAAAIATQDKNDARDYAAFLMRESRFAPVDASAEPSDRIARWHRDKSTQCLEACCESAGWKPTDLLKPPPRSDPESRSYCPRCLGEFILAEGSCSDCGSVPLQGFEDQK